MDMIPCPRTVSLVMGDLSIQYRRYMGISHVVWVLIFIILIMVFCDGYVGEYMVAVTEFSQMVSLYVCARVCV